MSDALDHFKALVQRGNYVVLDTETTHLHNGEIVQIAIIDSLGSVLLDTFVKPIYSIPMDASQIHGITNEQVVDSPGWSEITGQVQAILTGRDVIVYNAVYDRKMMHQSAEKAGLEKVDWKVISRWHCAMQAFAEVYGDWNSYRSSYRWKSLTTAAHYYELAVQNAHSALGDCRMTLAVIKKLAGLT